MGFNKKVLSQIKSDLNSAKAPARKKDIIVDPAGQWKYPGQTTRIPSNQITMQGVNYPVFAQPNIGQPQMMYPGQDYNFPGADYVDEYPQMKKGGQKKYSRSLEATNKLFTANPYVKKKKSKKKKIFNPNAKYYQDGGTTKLTAEEEKAFQNFYNTLPENLQTDDPTYDIRGYWDSEGRPDAFDYSQPKEDDGYYHAYSINSNTGEYLKSPAHETFQHAIDEDRKIGYRPIPNVYGRNIATYNPSIMEPTPNSFLRNMEGPVAYKKGGKLGPIPLNSGRKTLRDWTYGESIGMLQEGDGGYIELDLTPEEIEEYKRGGYVVEDISIPSLTRFTDGGSKKKKKKKKESDEGFEFTSNTQFYKMNNDPTRAYAKSDNGNWYEYKSSQVGYDENGNRIMKGSFYPIDPSYDVEKNLVPNVTAMSEDEKMAIKRSTIQLPQINVKAKQNIFQRVTNNARNKYWDALLTDEEKQKARDLYNSEYITPSYEDKTRDSYLGNKKMDNVNINFFNEKERLYPSIYDAYQSIYNSKEHDKRVAQEENQRKKALNKLKKEDPEAYQQAIVDAKKLEETADERYEASQNYLNELRSKPQSAQSADWLWTAGVLGGAGIGSGAASDLAYTLGDLGESALAGYSAPNFGLGTTSGLVGEGAANALTWENLIRAYTLGDLGKEYIIDPAITGKAPELSIYNTAGDLVSLLSPINRYTSGLSTSKSVGEGLSDFYEKGTPQSLDDIRKLGKTTIGISKLPKIKQYGGEQDYEEAELTPEEIEAYRRQGYIIEEY